MGNGGSTHKLVIVTGDIKGASCKSVKLSINFTDSDGKAHELEDFSDSIWSCTTFDKGESKEFDLELQDLGKIVSLRIDRDDTGQGRDWYVDRMEVYQLATEPQKKKKKEDDGRPAGTINKSIFPVNRWIASETSIIIAEYDSSIPQLAPNKEQRRLELMAKREKYMLSGKVLDAPPQVEYLPKDEQFSFDYLFKLGGTAIWDKIDSLKIKLLTPRFDSLEDIEAIYEGSGYAKPKGMKNWKSDVHFGQQRLTGVNPALIQLCKKIPDNFAVTAAMLKPHLEGKTMQKAMSADRLFIIDLGYMAYIECTDDRGIPGPICLFYQRDSGDLVPVAIQLMPIPDSNNPVFTPSDQEYTWMVAKMWYNLADASLHQSSTHLGLTHLLMDSVAVCTNRRLSMSHPIHRLLAPHFLYLLAINSLALQALVGPGGWVEKTMQIGRVGMFNIISKEWDNWGLKTKGNLLNDFKRRGVDKPDLLPNYHYRDDSKLLWEAIERYVGSVVNSVYDTSAKLKGDTEIQAWARELVERAKFKDMPSKLTCNKDLTEIVTVFIFISSVQHAAVNFEQYDSYAFPPNYPVRLDIDRPTSKKELSQDYVVETLPNKTETLSVMEITHVLSQKATNSLGDFEVQYAYDPASMEALKNFKKELKEISATITRKNKTRKHKYDYLNPKNIPNAISI